MSEFGGGRIVPFTEIRGRAVVDAAGETVGRARDLAVLLRGLFPVVTKLVVAMPAKSELTVSWELLGGVSPDRRAPLVLTARRAEIPEARLRGDEMRLAQSLLDKKMVDTARRKVVRVNDFELRESDLGFQLVAVEVGLRGLLRHLHAEGLVDRLCRSLGWRLPREAVSWEVVEPVETDLTRARLTAVYTKLARLHPADIADVMEELNPRERAIIVAALDHTTAAEAISEAEPEVQASLVGMLEREKAADVLETMQPDEAADVLHDLPPAKAQELLETMAPEEAEEVAELLEHPEDTAGGLMTTAHVTLPPELTAGEAIARLRGEARQAETIYYLYVTDPQERLRGVLSLRELIQAEAGRPIGEFMERDVISVPPETELRDVAERLTKYNLLALPVTDAAGELKGIVTVDDVLGRILPMIWRRRAVKKFI
jgi:CBS domain-containing protein